MKYKKLLTITLVSLLLCTSVSMIATANNKMEKSVFGKLNVKDRISDIINTLRSKFPILAGILDIIMPSKPSEPVQPQPPFKVNLSYDIEIKEVYQLKEEICVATLITNNGEKEVGVDEMNLRCGTINLIINTPAGRELRYLGDTSTKPLVKIIREGQTLIHKIRDITLEGLFWEQPVSESQYTQYDSPFDDAGTYTIQGLYRGYIHSTSGVYSQFQIKLESPVYEFEIVE